MTTLPQFKDVRVVPNTYHVVILLFLAAYAFFMLLLVDVTRGLSELTAISRGGLVGLSLLTMAVSYRWLKDLETALPTGIALHVATRWVSGALIGIPIAALLLYRAIGGARIATAGTIRIREVWPVAEAPLLMKPLMVVGNYLYDTWFATLIALLIGGAVLALWPAFLQARLRRGGWASHFLAAVLALPNMFCSCCASPIAGSLYKSGVAVGPTLAFAVAAPSLNIMTLLLAMIILPPELAVVRLLGGLVMALPLTYAAAILARRWGQTTEAMIANVPAAGGRQWWQLPFDFIIYAIGRACRFETLDAGSNLASPGDVVGRWLRWSWTVGRAVLPLLVLGYLLAGMLTVALPHISAQGNGVGAIVITALVGTMVMIPTAVEIPTAMALAEAGLPSLAVVALITLPAVSLPSLLVVGNSMGNYRPVAALGLLVFVFGLSLGIGTLWLG